jgi:hypothetical protein
MPLSVETPAPPKKTMRRLSSTHCCRVAMAFSMVVHSFSGV